MKKAVVALTLMLLGAGALTACAKNSSASLAQKGQETQAMWGLDLESSAASEESASESESAQARVIPVADGVKMMEVQGITLRSISPVNVRSGPGTGFDKVGGLTAKEEVEVTGICDNEWIQISFDRKSGFVSASYLEAIDKSVSLEALLEQVKYLQVTESSAQESSTESSATESSSSPGSAESSSAQTGTGKQAWATRDVNMRQGPAARYGSVGILSENESVTILDDSDPYWWKVQYNGKEVYVYSEYLTQTAPSGSTTQTSGAQSGEGAN